MWLVAEFLIGSVWIFDGLYSKLLRRIALDTMHCHRKSLHVLPPKLVDRCGSM
jgi:hypothetical protein